MLVTDFSFITMIREQDIVINPYDMNVLLTTIGLKKQFERYQGKIICIDEEYS